MRERALCERSEQFAEGEARVQVRIVSGGVPRAERAGGRSPTRP
jgi:hypothetical protein